MGISPIPDIASSLNNVGVSYEKLGDEQESLVDFEQALEMQKAFYGDAALNKLGGMFDDKDEEPSAKKLRTSEGPTDQDEGLLNHYYHGDSYVGNALAMSAGGNPTAESHNLILSGSYFGAKEWEKYLGDVGPEPVPDLPSDIDAVLDGPCPFWPGKEVRDTHLLVLIPATVDGAPFTLNLLGKLIQRPKNGGHQTKYRYYGDATKTQLGEKSPDRSYWLLMTREVLAGSRNKSYAEQRALVAGYTGETGLPYELPSVLEAATAVLLHHARTGERLFGNSPLTYTRCQELVAYKGDNYPAVVGGFDSSGLCVYSDDGSHDGYDNDSDGVACSRKF
jgi:hypothetical protein